MNEQMKSIMKFLDDNNIVYESIKHKPVLTALPPIPELVEKGYCDIKNLMLTTKNKNEEYYLVCSNVYKEFKIKDLASQIGSSRLTFVSKEWLDENLGVYPGIVSILNLVEGRRDGITLIIDKELTDETKLCFHPNQNDYMFAFSVDEFYKLLEVLKIDYKIVDIC